MGGVNMIEGACRDHDNPDLWFPEIGRGSFGMKEKLQKLAIECNAAMAICKSCPVKAECLEEGMKFENRSYGIWGGLMAGERLIEAGEQPSDHHRMTPQGDALNMLYKLQPYLRR
jgi:hypothetical protein